MATDPRKLRPAELCRMLNSTPLGEVVSERQLLRHRNRAGLRIGEGSTVDLLRYAAWLVQERHRPKPEPEVDPYEKVKERARARAAALAHAGRDIGQLPAVVNPDRKRQASEDFRYFCESYFPLSFSLAWSPDHLKVIGKVEQAVLRGGLFAMAMPRGSGKSTICEIACIWALLYGHRDFVCLIGSDEGHAEDSLDSIKAELAGNEQLLEDFPEVVYCMSCLRPSGNGTSSGCVGSDGNSVDNYLLVDDPTSDADTTYVQSDATLDVDLYVSDDLPASAGNVLAVHSLALWKKTSVASKVSRQVCRIGGTNYESGDASPTTTYAWHSRLMETSPATSAAWSVREVNAAEFGVKDQSGGSSLRVTQVAMEAIWQASPAGMVKAFVGGAWKKAPVKAYVGGSWKTAPAKVYVGGAWKGTG